MIPPAGILEISNRKILKKLLVASVMMFGFGFALVPFYESICQITGLRNVLNADQITPENTQVDATRLVSVEFDANIRRLPWTFRPLQSNLSVHPGEVTQIVYEVRNTLDRPVTGQAIPSYGPQQAAPFFRKIECFCFQQQTLAAGEVRRMPVVFVIDPKLPPEVNTVVLSYTFFEVNGAGEQG